ncbi:hypothetical protein CsatA_002567 [Cannabis sativa]
MWYCVPKLSFSDSNLENDPKKFYNYVDNYLEHHKRGMYFIPDSAITSFKLRIAYSYRLSEVCHLDKWLGFVAENKVKEIDIFVKSQLMIFDYIEFDLVELDSRYSFSFPSLKTLSLSYVGLVDNDVIDKLLLGFPSLEKLQLHKCCLSSRLRDELHINIQHSLSLKVLDIILTNDLVEKN